MNKARFIYAGPSWAVTSFPDQNSESTNLAREWAINHVSVAVRASTVLEQLFLVQNQIKHTPLPVIWIYNEPVADIKRIIDQDYAQFCTSSNWQELAKTCNDHCLSRINDLGIPILLIGAHSDVTDCDYENITVGHHSWQKWLAAQSGMRVSVDGVITVTPADGSHYSLARCWGAEVIQRFLHMRSDVKPTSSLLDAIWNMYYFWEELERRDWFFQVHPNRRGNVEFAKFLKPTIDTFLGEV